MTESKMYRLFTSEGEFAGFFRYTEDMCIHLSKQGWDLKEVWKDEPIAVSQAMWNVINRYVPKEEFDKDPDLRIILALITDRFVDVKR